MPGQGAEWAAHRLQQNVSPPGLSLNLFTEKPKAAGPQEVMQGPVSVCCPPASPALGPWAPRPRSEVARQSCAWHLHRTAPAQGHGPWRLGTACPGGSSHAAHGCRFLQETFKGFLDTQTLGPEPCPGPPLAPAPAPGAAWSQPSWAPLGERHLLSTSLAWLWAWGARRRLGIQGRLAGPQGQLDGQPARTAWAGVWGPASQWHSDV